MKEIAFSLSCTIELNLLSACQEADSKGYQLSKPCE
jgi:hypothetical protein